MSVTMRGLDGGRAERRSLSRAPIRRFEIPPLSSLSVPVFIRAPAEITRGIYCLPGSVTGVSFT
jgi:hypothetical protein